MDMIAMMLVSEGERIVVGMLGDVADMMAKMLVSEGEGIAEELAE
jgi:hypothetical protein